MKKLLLTLALIAATATNANAGAHASYDLNPHANKHCDWIYQNKCYRVVKAKHVKRYPKSVIQAIINKNQYWAQQ